MLAGLLLSLELRFASALLLVLGALTANQFYKLTPHPPQLGEACFAAVLPIVILTFLTRPRITTAAVAWTVIGLVALSIASLFRQSIGMMGGVATFASIGLNLVRTMPTKRRAIMYAVALAGAIASTFATPILLRVRDAAFNIPPTEISQRHGVFHSIYIGLGVVDNPFGIAWDDRVGYAAAEKAVPGTIPLTPAYQSVMRGLYFDIVRNNPLTVLRIYGEKLWITLAQGGPGSSVFQGRSIGVVLAFAVITGGCLRWWLWRQNSKKDGALSEIDAVATVALMFVAFFVAQGTIIHFDWQYLFPLHAFLIVILGLVLQYWIVLEQTMRAHHRA
jgi:membrane protein YdbS with pleckstrin-like domain